jgi:hypothetical protein
MYNGTTTKHNCTNNITPILYFAFGIVFYVILIKAIYRTLRVFVFT